MVSLSLLIVSGAWLFFFLGLGFAVKRTLFPNLLIPSSLLAGTLAFLSGPQLLGSFLTQHVPFLEGIWLDQTVVQVWKQLPGYLIVVVFAGIFLGKSIPSLPTIVRNSGPNLGFGYTLALGQYIVGIFAVVLVIQHFYDIKPAAGALIAVAFQGGHGTVAGLGPTFEKLDFATGETIGLGLATIGLVSAIVVGTLVSNKVNRDSCEPEINHETKDKIDVKPVSFSLQLSILAMVIALAYLLLTAAQHVESVVLPSKSGFFSYVPLFPVAMLVGLAVQKATELFNKPSLISNYHINITSNVSLDLLIIAALGALDLSTLQSNWQVITLLGAVGVTYNLLIYFAFARYFFANNWRIKGIGEIGQSMGTTAVGLLLLKQASTQHDKNVQAFSHKQPLYEPIVGGGLVTAIAVPAIASSSPWLFMGITSGALVTIWVVFYYYKKRR